MCVQNTEQHNSTCRSHAGGTETHVHRISSTNMIPFFHLNGNCRDEWRHEESRCVSHKEHLDYFSVSSKCRMRCLCMNIKVRQSLFIPTLLALVLRGSRTDLPFTVSVEVLPLFEGFFLHKESVAFVSYISFHVITFYSFLILSSKTQLMLCFGYAFFIIV